MARQDDLRGVEADDLERLLSRDYEDHLDWLENQPRELKRSQELSPEAPGGVLAALREMFGRICRPAR